MGVVSVRVKRSVCPDCGHAFVPRIYRDAPRCPKCRDSASGGPVPGFIDLDHEKCGRCGHTFRPRKYTANPICPKCKINTRQQAPEAVRQ